MLKFSYYSAIFSLDVVCLARENALKIGLQGIRYIKICSHLIFTSRRRKLGTSHLNDIRPLATRHHIKQAYRMTILTCILEHTFLKPTANLNFKGQQKSKKKS